MKKLIPFLLLTCASFGSEKPVISHPIWDQDLHFQKYQGLMIESAIHRIEDILKECKANEIDLLVKSMISHEIEIIKLNLGLTN